jgi:subtilisin family serine protease
VAAVVALLVTTASLATAGDRRRFPNLDAELNRRAASARAKQFSSVIVRLKGLELPVELRKYAKSGKLDLVNGYVLDVPDADLKQVANNPAVAFASVNGLVRALNFRTGVQSGAFFARRMMGLSGAGVSVAVLDSGIAPVDDFGKSRGFGRMPRPNRIAFFKDFVGPNPTLGLGQAPCTSPCDPNGHGTHVAGTIAGNGFDSFGEKSGIAPDASLIALRVLGRDGSGSVAGVLAALEWVSANAKARNIRVVNLSFGMVPTGSLPDDGSIAALLAEDPLAVATKALVDAGVFVVGAAGNFGQIPCDGLSAYPSPDPTTGNCDVWGGISAPGTYPWVFTAGASTSQGTFGRDDDRRAAFSSRGPAFPLQNAKPDLLAGAVGIESVAAPGSALYKSAAGLGFLLPGSFPMATLPYMALSGTSQATAVISGVAALMIEANPKLTPNLMKAILQYTAEDRAGSNALDDGAGFVNALGAVRLARFYATSRRGQRVPVQPIWSRHFIWGNHEMSGGIMLPGANAWQLGVVWGTPRVNGNTGDNVVWGTSCGSADCGANIVWGTSSGDNVVWGTADGDNVVWGTAGSGDNIVWGTSAGGDNVVWGTDCGGQDCGGNVVWGTAASGDNVVWGTANAGDNVVWGTSANGDNVVWGTNSNGDNIVWGTAFNGDNVVWGAAADGDNVVWGTASAAGGILWDAASDGDNVVWGTDGDNVVWGTDGDDLIWGTGPLREPVTQTDWYRLLLHRRFAIWWVANEFGDRFVWRGHLQFKPSRLLKRRTR